MCSFISCWIRYKCLILPLGPHPWVNSISFFATPNQHYSCGSGSEASALLWEQMSVDACDQCSGGSRTLKISSDLIFRQKRCWNFQCCGAEIIYFRLHSATLTIISAPAPFSATSIYWDLTLFENTSTSRNYLFFILASSKLNAENFY